MRRTLFFLAGLIVAASALPAAGQDSLEAVIKRATLTKEDKSVIQVEVERRVKSLSDAVKDPAKRIKVRDGILHTARVKGAPSANVNLYVDKCANELAGLVTSEAYATASDAAMLLVELDNGKAAPALAAGLSSRHAPVRLMSARGIANLHNKLKEQPETCELVLKALGRAGALEPDEHVLRVMYEAIYFNGDVPDFKYVEPCAAALNAIFEFRLRQLGGGSRDETRDEIGYDAAAACYGGTTPAQQARMMASMTGFLSNAVERYFDPNTAGEYLPTLAKLIEHCETAIIKMIQASGRTPPGERVSSKLKPRAADRSGQEKEARAALKALLDGLKP